MKRLPFIALSALLALRVSAQPVENVCEVAERYGLIVTNLTANQGCEPTSLARLCSDFIACMKKQPACLVANGRVRGGRTAVDFTPGSSGVTFGVRRVRDALGRESCFIASLSAAPGEDSPSWDYALFDAAHASGSLWTNKPGRWLRTASDFFARSEQAARARSTKAPAQAR